MIICEDYDLIHFFWRGYITLIEKDFAKEYVGEIGYEINEFLKEFYYKKIITTAVYDHLFLDKDFAITEYVTQNVDNYYTSSNKLHDLYHNLNLKLKPSTTITDGIDLDLFKPINKDRFKKKFSPKNPMVIGWVGNSTWGGEKSVDFKGLKTIIEPAVLELQDEGYPVVLDIADANVKKIPLQEMPSYYQRINVYICASLHEGTPNPVLEAMACGIPVISTNVGIVEQAFGTRQKNLILKTRTIKELKEKILQLLHNHTEYLELSLENQEEIKKWSWSNKAKEFEKFFEESINIGRRKSQWKD